MRLSVDSRRKTLTALSRECDWRDPTADVEWEGWTKRAFFSVSMNA
jgi:hypothetical protein